MSLLDPECMPDEFHYVGPRSGLRKNLIPMLLKFVAHNDLAEARQIWALTVTECQGQPHAVARRLNHLIALARAERGGASRAAYGHAQMRGWSLATEAGEDGAAARQIWAEGDAATQTQTSAADLDTAVEHAAAMLPRQTARALRMAWGGADREAITQALGVDDRRLRQMLNDAELAVRAGARGGLRAAAAALRARHNSRHVPRRAPVGQLSLLDEEACHV